MEQWTADLAALDAGHTWAWTLGSHLLAPGGVLAYGVQEELLDWINLT